MPNIDKPVIRENRACFLNVRNHIIFILKRLQRLKILLIHLTNAKCYAADQLLPGKCEDPRFLLLHHQT